MYIYVHTCVFIFKQFLSDKEIFKKMLIYRVHNYHPVNTTIFYFRCVLFQKIFSPGQKDQKGQHTHTYKAKYGRKTT